MAVPWILASKLAQPALPPGWLPRPGLVPDPLPSLVLLAAGPGAGKTLAMLSLVARRDLPGAITLWYALDEADGDPVAFFHHLLASMRARIPDFALELDAMLASPEPDAKRVWSTFFASAAAYDVPAFTLALDELHHLADAQPGWVRALVPSLERLPPGHAVLATTRRAGGFPLARLVAAGRAIVLGPERLHFDPDEQAAFLQARAGDRPVPEAWRARAATLEGWPLGLRLMASDAAVRPRGGDDELTAYVAEELVQTQPPDRRAFMLRAALLEEATVEAAAAVLGDPRAPDHLAALADDQLVARLADGRTYRFPSYLRAFLQAEAMATLPAEELAALHRRAAGYQRDRGRADLAVPHHLAADDLDGALAACQGCFEALAATGRHEPIGRWLDAFPSAFVARQPFLLLWQGTMHVRHGEGEAALEAFERARRLFAEADEPAQQFKALVRQCAVLACAEDGKRARSKLMQAQALLAVGADLDRADLLLVRALLADQRGDMALVRECNEAVLALADPGPEVASGRWIASINLHTLKLHQGDLDGARRHALQAIAIAERHAFVAFALFARFLAADLAIVEGAPEEASALIRGLAPGWPELLEVQDRGVAWAVVGHAHMVRGAWREADDALARSASILERAGLRTAAKVPLERQAWAAIARGQPARALRLCDAAGALGDNVYDMALALVRARALHLAGDLDGALAAWPPLVAGLEAQGAKLLAVRARLAMAASLGAAGRADAAGVALAEATSAMDALGYGFLRQQDPALWAELEAHHPVERAPLRVVADVPAGDLELRCFGSFEARLGGRLLDAWSRRKAKRVLAALALAPSGMESPQLAVAMGESDAAAGITAMRMAVLAVRRALEPDLAKGEDSRYIRSTEHGYVLAAERLGAVDVQSFSSAVERARGCGPDDVMGAAAAYEDALGTYRGNLLEETFFAGLFEPDRLGYQRDALEALRFLHLFHIGRGDRTSGEAVLRRAIALAPCEEELYVALMRFYQAGGQAERVRQTYWDYRKALKAELAAAPGAGFEAAYRGIVGDNGMDRPGGPGGAG